MHLVFLKIKYNAIQKAQLKPKPASTDNKLTQVSAFSCPKMHA